MSFDSFNTSRPLLQRLFFDLIDRTLTHPNHLKKYKKPAPDDMISFTELNALSINNLDNQAITQHSPNKLR